MARETRLSHCIETLRRAGCDTNLHVTVLDKLPLQDDNERINRGKQPVHAPIQQRHLLRTTTQKKWGVVVGSRKRTKETERQKQTKTAAGHRKTPGMLLSQP